MEAPPKAIEVTQLHLHCCFVKEKNGAKLHEDQPSNEEHGKLTKVLASVGFHWLNGAMIIDKLFDNNYLIMLERDFGVVFQS